MTKYMTYGKEEEDKRVYLALFDEEDGVALCAVDIDGKRLLFGTLLKVKHDGMVHMTPGVGDGLGFSRSANKHTVQVATDSDDLNFDKAS